MQVKITLLYYISLYSIFSSYVDYIHYTITKAMDNIVIEKFSYLKILTMLC